jgi:ribonuclease Y
VTDEQASMLSYDIARKIERELNYPGQVKVTVVREVRVIEHAR